MNVFAVIKLNFPQSYSQWATSPLFRHNGSNPVTRTSCQKPAGLFWLAASFSFLLFFFSLHFTDLQPRPWTSVGGRRRCACTASPTARTPCSDAWCTVTAWVSMNLNGVFTGGSTSAGWWDGLILAASIWPWWISCGAVDGSYQNSPRLCVFPSMMHRLLLGPRLPSWPPTNRLCLCSST